MIRQYKFGSNVSSDGKSLEDHWQGNDNKNPMKPKAG